IYPRNAMGAAENEIVLGTADVGPENAGSRPGRIDSGKALSRLYPGSDGEISADNIVDGDVVIDAIKVEGVSVKPRSMSRRATVIEYTVLAMTGRIGGDGTAGLVELIPRSHAAPDGKRKGCLCG